MTIFGRSLYEILIRVAMVFILLPIHEYAHAWTSTKLGDPTAMEDGRLTLNPLAHLDPLGTLMLIFAGFGWAKPVPFDLSYFKNPRRDVALTAAAGPISNILIALVAFLFAKIGILVGVMGNISILVRFSELLYSMGYISVSLAVFNLLPIPPLDGSKIFAMLLPIDLYMKFVRIGRFATPLLFLLVYMGFLDRVIFALSSFLADVLWGILFFIPNPL